MSVVEQSPIPVEAFGPYAGKWIAIRDGEVIAAADSLQELRANPAVTREDAVHVVAERAS